MLGDGPPGKGTTQLQGPQVRGVTPYVPFRDLKDDASTWGEKREGGTRVGKI
jgi:hypothetical protein